MFNLGFSGPENRFRALRLLLREVPDLEKEGYFLSWGFLHILISASSDQRQVICINHADLATAKGQQGYLNRILYLFEGITVLILCSTPLIIREMQIKTAMR